MDRKLKQAVHARARNLCEYCLIPASSVAYRFPVDHIIARQHDGPTELENLALCCAPCNRQKGPNISGVDPLTRRMERLFNPRADRWSDHFRLLGPKIVGLTAIGRTTIAVLKINHKTRVQVRLALMALGLYPPSR